MADGLIALRRMTDAVRDARPLSLYGAHLGGGECWGADITFTFDVLQHGYGQAGLAHAFAGT